MGQHADLSGVGKKALTLAALASTSHFFLFCDNLTALESTLKPQEEAQPLGLKSNLGKKPISKRSLSNGLKKREANVPASLQGFTISDEFKQAAAAKSVVWWFGPTKPTASSRLAGILYC